MLAIGIDESQITLISPYRPQLKQLAFTGEFDRVEVSTIDKYQGRDKECVIISLVRSNPDQQIGELLNDWQRLNVAFTRAKKKLIFVGSSGTVLSQASFRAFNSLLLERRWLFSIPSDAASHTISANI